MLSYNGKRGEILSVNGDYVGVLDKHGNIAVMLVPTYIAKALETIIGIELNHKEWMQ